MLHFGAACEFEQEMIEGYRALFLHRKLASPYLLAQRLGVTLPIGTLIERWLLSDSQTVDKEAADCHS